MRQKHETDDILEKKNLKENPFGVPFGYFSSMQDEIMAKISAIPEEPRPTFFTYFKPALALAAVFGIVFGLGYGAMKLTGTYNERDTAVQQLTASDNSSESSLSDEDIISIFNISIEEMFASEGTYTSIEIEEHSLSDEDIEQYLIDSRVSAISLALLE